MRDPFLRGKPVGVLGNQGACVIAKSYEMKAAGVKTGEPIWEAVVKCPEGIYVKRDFHWYEAVSRRMLDITRELSPRVEYYSIDEFFFLAAPRPGQTFEALAESIRDRIREEAEIPVRVGIARTRALAKLISDSTERSGVKVVMDTEGEETLLASLPVTEVSGIAGRRAAKLTAWGIQTCLDFARADRRLIRELLTATGEKLWWELNGDPVEPIQPRRPAHKMLSRGGSLGGSATDPETLHAWLVRNLERLVEELEYYGVLAGKVTVFLSYRDGQPGSSYANLAVPSDRFDTLLEALGPCLDRAWRPHSTATHMHLVAADLTPAHHAPLGLFDPPDERGKVLSRLKREVNARHGRFILRSAATLPINDIYHDTASDYDIGDIRGKFCF
ncbi:DNA polymerase Y family protein [Singulisphaera sp. PoT]|uniref:DNA polymerase Y family protein n=1 Tax=Singulisphaera sp. PoT TaxID=3411797 RepID=UPI003BF49D73